MACGKIRQEHPELAMKLIFKRDITLEAKKEPGGLYGPVLIKKLTHN